MHVIVRAERAPAFIDEPVRVIVYAVTLESRDSEAVDASVGNVTRRARVQGRPLFFFGNHTSRMPMPLSPAVFSPQPYLSREVGRCFLKSQSVRVGPRRRRA